MTPVPNCPGEDGNCTPLEIIDLGGAVVVTDPETNCGRSLSGVGLVGQTELGAKILDGSLGSPIELPELIISAFSTEFDYLAFFNGAGQMQRLEPTIEETPLFLAMEDGKFKFRDIRPVVCYDNGDICGDCDNDFVAGFTLNEETNRLCLTKIPMETFTSAVDKWADTETVDIQGAGVVDDEYKAHVKISPDVGNWLEARPNGLYLAIPISAVAGNIIQLLPDGLWATYEELYD